jgi:hypothetical protein
MSLTKLGLAISSVRLIIRMIIVIQYYSWHLTHLNIILINGMIYMLPTCHFN